MLDFNDLNSIYQEDSQEPYPDFFEEWDDALSGNRSPRFLDGEELCEIVEIYLEEGEDEKARKTIHYALTFHPDDLDMISDILLVLNDFELWEDLLHLTDQYIDKGDVWVDGHRLSALLHLGMEEDAFLCFQQLKKKHKSDKEDLEIIYQAMGEALVEVGLFDGTLDVMEEAIRLMGDQVDFYWLQLRALVYMENRELALSIASIIEKLSPMDGESWHRLGLIYSENLEEPEKAIDAFEFAESLNYNDPDNHLKLIDLYEKYGIYHRALDKVKSYIHLYGETSIINLLAAGICSQAEWWNEALRYVNAALRLEPDTSILYLYKSNFLYMLGEPQKAIWALEEGLQRTEDGENELKAELEKLKEKYPDIE